MSHFNDPQLVALAQIGALRLRCDYAVVSLVGKDRLSRVAAEAGQNTWLCGLYKRSASSDHLRQYASLNQIQSLAFFRRRRPAERSDDMVANHTRHIARDLDLLDSHKDDVPTGPGPLRVSYAAVPIRSVSGQLLGVYSVMDSKIRDDFLDAQTCSVLNDIAGATLRYLESQHTQLEQDQDTQAKIHLSRFLEHNRPQPARNVDATRPQSSLLDSRAQSNSDNPSPTNSSSSRSTSTDIIFDGTAVSAASTPLITPADECSGFSFVNPPPMPIFDKGSMSNRSRVLTVSNGRLPHRALSVAVNLIRAAHDLEGLVLLNATHSSDHSPLQSSRDTTDEQVSTCEKLEVSIFEQGPVPTRITSSMSIEHESLTLLISYFPEGCVLRIGDEGVLALVVTDTSRSGPALYEKLDETIVVSANLQLLLHRARSIIFMPLWDSARQAFFAGMLGWAADPVRVFTEHDLLSLSIYGRILTAEITRLDATDTEATKSDFVSSLSHELRSPLHGCLGAVEVLRDTALDKSQTDLLGMIDSCASTLLFTMNHLLDFSKINDLDRTQSRNRKQSQGEILPHSLQDTFGQASEDYVCRIVQGVVEGVWYGHDREQAAHEREPSTLPRDHIMHFNRDSPIAKYKDVAVFLYMESHAAWFSMVSAGAWKRLVMNLFGNSLKFCQRGQIEVTLKMMTDPKDPEKKLAHLAVSDTGIGMSENFLEHGLYRPFVQANSLVSGTGLGLNIVKQIVTDLQGTISVKSTLGAGTRFDVFIPLVQRKTIPDSEVVPDGGEMLDPESLLGGRTICLLSSSHTSSTSTDTPPKRTRLVHSYVKSIAENWFNMKVVLADMADKVDADIYVAEVSDYASHAGSTSENSGMIDRHRLILVGNSREISQARHTFSDRVVELNYPLGPRSLSRALHIAMGTPQASKIVAIPTTASPRQTRETLDIEFVIQEPEDAQVNLRSKQTLPTPYIQNTSSSLMTTQSTSNSSPHLSRNYPVDGEDAFEIYKRFAKTKPFTTILMDISMPKMNGFESSRAIRDFEVENNLPPSRIIALTALGSGASRREAEASGIDEFQTKPVALQTLKGLLQSTS
ncbi:hypothetical protein E4T44_05156 [Aureobasidium sp. EXF-8845]|nr:hypothetical protein E4T44_05156 [Aureobasidium sp. EXF-8845]KAI4851394.1 hypothetical protein E4T45_05103 [Aureobasidium sp. EXF-8846]